jgi:hypothetical protein
MHLHQAKQQLASILRDNLYTRHTIGKHGTLAPQRLGLAPLTENIWSRPTETGNKAYHVTILLDGSGSTIRDDVAEDMFESTKAIFQLLQGNVETLQVYVYAMEMQTLTMQLPRMDYRQYKSLLQNSDTIHAYETATYRCFLKDNTVKKLHGVTRCEDSNELTYYLGNMDMQALGKTIKEMGTLQGNKIILHISDGEPFVDYHTSDRWNPKESGKDWLCYGTESTAPYITQKGGRFWEQGYDHVQHLANIYGVSLFHYGIECRIDATYPSPRTFSRIDSSELYDRLLTDLRSTIPTHAYA